MSPKNLLLKDSSRMKAIGLICAAIFFFALLDSTAKYAVTLLFVPLFQVVWMRFVSHAVLNLVALGPRGFVTSLKSTHPGHQFLRSLFLFGCTAFNFSALRYLQLDQAVTIFFLTPFFVAVLAGPLLGEWIGWRRMLAVMVGFSGVILVVRPGFGGIHWAVLYSFGSVMCYALYIISTRYLARYDPPLVTQVWSPLGGLIVMAPLGISVWVWPSDLLTWALICSTGLWGGFGHYLLIQAHRRAPAPVLAPFSYIGLLFQATIGYLLFRDVPSIWTAAGGTVIVASGIYLLHRERVRETDAVAATSLSSDSRG